MNLHYTSEKNAQLLIALMKKRGIRKVIVSPGAQNICFVGSIQSDRFFEIYSAPDERSAAYMACGMAAESGEAVALSCTGATASRNYFPALTEAYYRKLPILAVTATKHQAFVGQNVPQVIDRSVVSNDIAKMSIYVPTILCEDDEWGAVVKLNTALLELTRDGGGPVHINLETTHSADYSVTELPDVRVIDRIRTGEPFTRPGRNRKIVVFAGEHGKWSEELTNAVDAFCEVYNAVVLCDHTSNYHGKFKVLPAMTLFQTQYRSPLADIDLLIEIGNVSGAYYPLKPREVWRIHPDGEIRDQFRKLRYVFEMEEERFFRRCLPKEAAPASTSHYEAWKNEYAELAGLIHDLPYSNIWMAGEFSKAIPENTVLHLAILNSLRSWNFYYMPASVDCYCNTGGFGIDGPVSTVMGGALADPDRVHFLVTGDLAFFYDMNAMGNRHFPSNVRILLVNNGIGTEFKNYNHKAARFGDSADLYMAAGGHYGCKSADLVRHYAQDLGFTYMTASSKEEFLEVLPGFTDLSAEGPMVFETFTNSADESDAYKVMKTLKSSPEGAAKAFAKKLLGKENADRLKRTLGR